ncbi:transmembrane protein 74 [Bombina bombina]|uniref:transmembrane protein 74 n=1 Tax=Bombina bombina TaxID=8345 RepID=UPI00235AD59C|nr:transmembrane protein 74 [Bombina bombina]XP_053569169.1 transmembrane protein 74 [Bombina bombina]
MELLHISAKTQTLDECNNVDWSYNTWKNDDKNSSAQCYDNQFLASAVSPDQYESIPLGPSFEGPEHLKSFQDDYSKGRKNTCCVEELETSFTYVDENVNIELVTHPLSNNNYNENLYHNSETEIHPEGIHEASIMSDDEAVSEASGKSVDYGFISAVTFLITGILLVIISYLVPKDVKSDPNLTSAREMEKIEKENARIGAHLDRCVIAGLCLLTLGGVVLSVLLMVSLWKGELYRRKALAAKDSAKLYGSINFNHSKSGGNENTLVQEETIDIIA